MAKKTQFAQWRAKVGMTQAEAARALGVTINTIGHYETGRHTSTKQPMSPPEPVRKLMRVISLGITVEPWPADDDG